MLEHANGQLHDHHFFDELSKLKCAILAEGESVGAKLMADWDLVAKERTLLISEIRDQEQRKWQQEQAGCNNMAIGEGTRICVHSYGLGLVAGYERRLLKQNP